MWSFNYDKAMLLLITHILLRSKFWKACKVRLFIVSSIEEEEHQTLLRVIREYLERYRLFEGVTIKVVKVSIEDLDNFTYDMQLNKQHSQIAMYSMAKDDRDFEYGTLPSLMKLNALQEKELEAAHSQRRHREGLLRQSSV